MQRPGDQSQWMESCTLQNCVISGKEWRMWERGRLLSTKSNMASIVLSSFWPSAVPSGLMFNPESLASAAWTGSLSYLLSTQALELSFQMEPDQAKTVFSCLYFPAFVTHLWDWQKRSLAFFFLYPSFPIPTPSFPSFLPMSPSLPSFPLCLPFLLTPSSSFPDSIHCSLTSNLWPFSLSFLSAGIVNGRLIKLLFVLTDTSVGFHLLLCEFWSL